MESRIEYGLNGATTGPLELAVEIREAASAGFTLLEFRTPKLEEYLEREGLPALQQLLAERGLRPLSLNALEEINTRPARGQRALEEECRKLAGWARELSCPTLVAVPGRLSAPQPEREVVPRTVDALAALAEIAAAHGVRVGFEFLGFRESSVNSLQMARRVLARLDHPAAGLVLDTFHFYLSGEPLELLSEIAPGELLVLHVNDAENRPRGELTDEHRLLPGAGVIPLREIWDRLRERKLVGHASLELFRPEYWKRSPATFLPEALDSLRRVFPD